MTEQISHKRTSLASIKSNDYKQLERQSTPKTSFEEKLKAHPDRKHHQVHLVKFAQPKDISLRQAQNLAKLAPIIKDAATRNKVPVELICGVILQESGGNPKAVSHAGARGLMQLMPGTAKRFGVKNSFDPVQNIEGGTRYLRFLLDRFNGDVKLALAGYNAGEGNVAKYGNKIPPFAETRSYVPAVLGYTQTMVNYLAALTPSADLPTGAQRV